MATKKEIKAELLVFKEAIEEINSIMWNGFMTKHKGFSSDDGHNIMKILNRLPD